MTRSLRRLGPALPTLFAFHAARTLLAVGIASPLLSVLGDSRWYAAAVDPARLELGLLAQVLLGASSTWLRLGPWLAAILLAYVVALPLATASCHRALQHPGRVAGHLAFAWRNRGPAYAVALAALGAHILWLATSACLAWIAIAASPDMAAPQRDVGIVLLALITAAGWLLTRTAHDIAMAAIGAGGSSLRGALRQAMRPRLCYWTSTHLASWVAIGALWGVAAAWGFALVGQPIAGAPVTAAAHQCIALAAACVRWWWLSTAAAIAAETSSRALHPAAGGLPA